MTPTPAPDLPDQARAAPGPATATSVAHAEVVTFRLTPGTGRNDFLAAAANTAAFLRKSGFVISRSLSCDETGLWTDYIQWADAKSARDTAAKAMQSPDFAPFLAMIAPDDFSMRHADILYQMD